MARCSDRIAIGLISWPDPTPGPGAIGSAGARLGFRLFRPLLRQRLSGRPSVDEIDG